MEFDCLTYVFTNFDDVVIWQVIKQFDTFEKVYQHFKEFNEYLQEEQ